MSNQRQRQEQQRKTSGKDWLKKSVSGYEATCIKYPEGVEQFKLQTGTILLDFMPFVVGQGNPNAGEGFEHPERQYDVHWIATPDGKKHPYACRYKCFGKSCSICKYLQSGRVDKATQDAYRAKTRHLWFVNDKPGVKNNPLKILDTNHVAKGVGFMELISAACDDLPEDATFYSLTDGYTAKLTIIEDSFPGGGKFAKVTRIVFQKRNYSYPAEMINSIPCLDDCVVCYDPVEMDKILSGGGEDGDEESGSTDGGHSHGELPSVSSYDPSRPTPELPGCYATHDLEAGNQVKFAGEVWSVKRVADDYSLVLQNTNDVLDIRKQVDPSSVVKVAPNSPPKEEAPAPKRKPELKDLDLDDDDVDF